MTNETIIAEIILPVLQNMKDRLVRSTESDFQSDTMLFGPNAIFDSFGLVTFIIEIEEKIEETYGIQCSIANEKAMSRQNSPFRTVGSLAEYILELLGEGQANE